MPKLTGNGVERAKNSRVLDQDQGRALRSGLVLAYNGICGLEHPMMDVVMLAIGFAFFALSIGYVYACDQL